MDIHTAINIAETAARGVGHLPHPCDMSQAFSVLLDELGRLAAGNVSRSDVLIVSDSKTIEVYGDPGIRVTCVRKPEMKFGDNERMENLIEAVAPAAARLLWPNRVERETPCVKAGPGLIARVPNTPVTWSDVGNALIDGWCYKNQIEGLRNLLVH